MVALLLLVVAWGALAFRDRRRHLWLQTARRAELQRYVSIHSEDPEAMVRLGILLRNSGETSEAEKRIRRAVEIAPNDERNWVEFSRTVTDDQEVIQRLRNYLQLKPDSAPVLTELARHYLQVGDEASARKLIEQAIQRSPELPEAWRVRGDLNAVRRQSPDAEKAYRKALALRDDRETRLSLARLLIPFQRYAEIIALCAPIVKAGPSADIPMDQRARALLYTAGGRLYDPLSPDSLALLQAQLREADSLAGHLTPGERFLPPYFLGESYLRAGKPAEAIPFLERSVAAGPLFAGSLYSLARAYRLTGDVRKADLVSARHARLSRILSELEMYNNRLEQRPDDAETMLRLAGTLTEAGNTSDASQIYQRLIDQGKFVETAQKKLKALSASH